MDHENLFINPNFHQQEPPLFLDLPSPFFDGISTIPVPTSIPENLTEAPSKSKSTHLKKRSGAKKDRHSKIHTAQGVRDRRMRLSLHIARKFFDLQDVLGYDKASNTIEWLFSKSKKAIKEVAEKYNPQHTNKSINEEICDVELITSEEKTATNNLDNSKEEEIKNKESRMKRIVPNNSSARDQARARARDRTRERLMIKELEKSKKLLGINPTEEIYKLGLGYIPSSNNHNGEELGFITSSPSEPIQQEYSSSSSLENFHTHHMLQEPQLKEQTNVLGNIPVGSWEGEMRTNLFSIPVLDREVDDLGVPESQSTCYSTLINHNPPAGWLNSWNGFSPGQWDYEDLVSEYNNYGNVPTVSLTGNIYEHNPSSFLMSSTTNILYVQPQNQGK
ncbi:hypothetical protein M8C21_006695 [Ambrosia artemisiifolia]|uniref:TCP domain-containing protein n=1 Tax=Ambrosia artemisiifolia TaxID=4212 RepID=A0AAD5GIK4_AMBAR|nr:hypothetical protein M8C21_006695 [Ambrosia artemisiifolia]